MDTADDVVATAGDELVTFSTADYSIVPGITEGEEPRPPWPNLLWPGPGVDHIVAVARKQADVGRIPHLHIRISIAVDVQGHVVMLDSERKAIWARGRLHYDLAAG